MIGIYQAEVLSVDYRVRCVHKTNHLLDFEPLDMIFDANDILWVFSLSTKQPIQVFGLQSTTEVVG